MSQTYERKAGAQQGKGRRKRAVIYLRVSSDKQVSSEMDPEGLSLPSQRKLCEDEAERLGADMLSPKSG